MIFAWALDPPRRRALRARDAATEDFPAGDARWAWTIATVFAAGAVVLAIDPRRAAGLVLDTAVVSAFVVLYAFEGGTPVGCC